MKLKIFPETFLHWEWTNMSKTPMNLLKATWNTALPKTQQLPLTHLYSKLRSRRNTRNFENGTWSCQIKFSGRSQWITNSYWRLKSRKLRDSRFSRRTWSKFGEKLSRTSLIQIHSTREECLEIRQICKYLLKTTSRTRQGQRRIKESITYRWFKRRNRTLN